MGSSTEPYAAKMGGETGITPYKVKVERRLSDLKGYFQEDEIVEEILSKGENPIIYEVYEIPQKPIEGQLNIASTIIKPGKIGKEYYFTKGHYHEKETASEIYIGIRGEGIILMQNRKGEAKHIKLEPNKIIYIPPGYAHRTINIGSDPLIFLAVYPSDAGHNYGEIAKIGFSKIVVEKDGRPTIEDNPKYKSEAYQ